MKHRKPGLTPGFLSSIVICRPIFAQSSAPPCKHTHVRSRWFIADDDLVLRHIDFSRPSSTEESSWTLREPAAIEDKTRNGI
jgi:hypothetical protein